MNKNIPSGLKFATFLAMLYVASDIASLSMTYKVFTVGPLVISAGSLIFPLTYMLADIIAEVYGYAFARKVIWTSLLCDLLFALITMSFSAIPNGIAAQQTAYWTVFSGLPQTFFGELIAVFSGAFINIYCVSRWKLLTHGRMFWLRSVGSSTIGDAVLVGIGIPLIYIGHLPMEKIFAMMACDYLYKVMFAIMVAFPATLIAFLLKNAEKVDVFDYSTNFNPFNLRA